MTTQKFDKIGITPSYFPAFMKMVIFAILLRAKG